VRTPFLSLLIEWIDRDISRPGSRGYLWSKSNQTGRIFCNCHACCTADTRFGLEHPRPHALGYNPLPSPSAGEPTNHREGYSGAGKTSLVREPNGRRGFKMFPLPTTLLCCSCRRQGGPTIFASGTSNTTGVRGTTSIGLLSRKDNRRACKSESRCDRDENETKGDSDDIERVGAFADRPASETLLRTKRGIDLE
jgi:hypothetical protein